MCGRFAQIEPLGSIEKAFFIDEVHSEAGSSYNVAPGNKVVSVVIWEGKRVLVDFQWGLIPHWAKDPKIGNKLINARSETVHEKPSFKSSFASKRCLIAANGFYEWKKEGDSKIPVYIKLSSRDLFAFAGLWSKWASGDKVYNTCTILTTDPNELLKPVHNRMPVILPKDKEEDWLDISAPQDEIRALLTPYPPGEMEYYPVSTFVNSPKNDSPECILRA